jgi:hypothetical protein
MAESKRAVSTFQTTIKGEEHFVHEGEVLPATHPAVKAAPELFEPAAATSAPKRRAAPMRRAARQTK